VLVFQRDEKRSQEPLCDEAAEAARGLAGALG
jgi:hypothetical protein